MVKVQLNHVKSLYFHMIYFSISVYLFIFLWFVFYVALIVNFIMCILIYFYLYKNCREKWCCSGTDADASSGF